jgi:hypothetical protein
MTRRARELRKKAAPSGAASFLPFVFYQPLLVPFHLIELQVLIDGLFIW